MKLNISWKNCGSAEGNYQVTASGMIAVMLWWADSNGALPDWTSFACFPIEPNGRGSFYYSGNRGIPPEATHVFARAASQDFADFEEGLFPVPEKQLSTALNSHICMTVMSDLHLTKKAGKIIRALKTGTETDAILIAGDMVNDGKPEQFALLKECIEAGCPENLVFAVIGNHDIPLQPLPQTEDYGELLDWLRARAEDCAWEQDSSGAYAVRVGSVEIIGLQALSHWRRFVFPKGEQLSWLDKHLTEANDADWHIILCHAPLLQHNPLREEESKAAYLSRNEQLQGIIDSNGHCIFISGHTHYSLNNMKPCVDWDNDRCNLYFNDGSICTTTLTENDKLQPKEWTEGNISYLRIGKSGIEIMARGLSSGKWQARGYFRIEI